MQQQDDIRWSGHPAVGCALQDGRLEVRLAVGAHAQHNAGLLGQGAVRVAHPFACKGATKHRGGQTTCAYPKVCDLQATLLRRCTLVAPDALAATRRRSSPQQKLWG